MRNAAWMVLLFSSLSAHAASQVVETTVYVPVALYRTRTAYGTGSGYSIFGLGASANLPVVAKGGATISYEMNLNSKNGSKIFSGLELGAYYRAWGDAVEVYKNAREQISMGSMDLISVSAGLGQKSYNFESLLKQSSNVLYQSSVQGLSGDAWTLWSAVSWSRLLENLSRVGVSLRGFASVLDAEGTTSLMGVRISVDWQFNLFGDPV
jgi:hypothetical protein